MRELANRKIARPLRSAEGMKMPRPNRRLAISQASLIEKVLLFLTFAVMPMQANLPKLRGFGFAFIIFGLVLAHQLFFRPRVFWLCARHRIYIAGYIFVGFIGVVELIHGNADVYGIVRIIFMLVGGIGVASLCRDRHTLYTGLIGYVVGAVVLSSILLMESYGNIRSISVTTGSFHDISSARGEAFSQSSLEENLNNIAFYASQGAIIALVLSLLGDSRTAGRRFFFAVIGLICIVSTFVTMSRTGIMIFLVAAVAIAYSYGLLRARTVAAAILLGLVMLAAVPSSVFTRLTYTTEKSAGGYEDSRAHIYTAALKHLPEYALTGVGMGHFYGDWGHGTEFENMWGNVSGTHNCFAQVMICWGVGGLLTFSLIIWNAYRSLPRRRGQDPLLLCLLGISVSAAVFLMFTHEIELKQFSAVLGLLAAADLWIWRAGILPMSSGSSTPRVRQFTETRLSFRPDARLGRSF